ncbi:oligopeptide transport system ATP-binding protein [Desulfacinum infernum DSM 9756]|uniref:Oligopeptide transport system ATP-binding protein n=1 Tax=Desulfacinum infernum DSM 9756 TaxID=1121391 RepID=A0A1M5ALQ5_9BACT|nr:oligopeptide transport system ATP-binding protein [Desulfacinum infernum DSM 9756]
MVQVHRLKKYFPIRGGIFSKVVAHVKAVDDVSLHIAKGEILGLVGESGCGKTTVGRLILGLMPPTSGDVLFEGVSLQQVSQNELRVLRRHMQIIFQDPYASLNPRMSVGEIIGEPLLVHGLMKGREKDERVAHLMETVGLDPRYASRYPHEFSGGQRQRVGIARALALQPKLIICDEAVSALDVSIQAQVINLLEELQEKFNLTYLFISHDLSVVKHISHRVAVMYLGKLVEMAPTEELYGNAAHPYTRALLSAVPVPDPDYRPEEILLSGEVPSPIDPPPGCRFHTRCFLSRDVCRQVEPELQEVAPGHFCACHVCD